MNTLLLAAALVAGTPNLEAIQTQTVMIQMDAGRNGSGIVIDGKRVLTCKHVVEDKQSGYVLKTNGSRIPIKVTKVSDKYDVAMVELIGARFICRTEFDKDIRLGESVWHCGAWLGPDRADSISAGIISKLTHGDYVQTTAFAINGSSGGGVFDDEGKCVGMVCMFLQVPAPTVFDRPIPLPVSYMLPSKTLIEFINE